MTATSDEQQGIGTAAYNFLTDPRGLIFEQEIPGDRAGVTEFVADEAARAGVDVPSMRATITARGFAHYVLDQLRSGHVPGTQAANLLGGHYHDYFRMAYSTGALTMSPSMLNALQGKPDDEIAKARSTPGLVVKEVAYRSSVDDLGPLYADVAFDPRRTDAPVMVLQHGDYPGSRLGMIPGLVQLARAGFLGIAVSKRGRDGSAGQGDTWGRETHDIYDAIQHCLREFTDHCDESNISIMGQSGGGMDTINCVARYPDLFRCAVDIAGTLDPALLVRFVGAEPDLADADDTARDYAAANRVFYALMSGDMGGEPDEVPDACLARDVSQCGVNNPYTRTFFVWDEQDGGVALYEPGTRRYLDDQRRHGYQNSELVVSRVGDPIRFFHWEHPDHAMLQHRFIPQLLSGTFPQPVLASAGRMVVPGYVVTRRFAVWLGAGNDAAARLEYKLSDAGGEFRFTRLTRDPSVRGRLTVFHPNGSDTSVEFGLDDIVRVPI